MKKPVKLILLALLAIGSLLFGFYWGKDPSAVTEEPPIEKTEKADPAPEEKQTENEEKKPSQKEMAEEAPSSAPTEDSSPEQPQEPAAPKETAEESTAVWENVKLVTNTT